MTAADMLMSVQNPAYGLLTKKGGTFVPPFFILFQITVEKDIGLVLLDRAAIRAIIETTDGKPMAEIKQAGGQVIILSHRADSNHPQCSCLLHAGLDELSAHTASPPIPLDFQVIEIKIPEHMTPQNGKADASAVFICPQEYACFLLQIIRFVRKTHFPFFRKPLCPV